MQERVDAVRVGPGLGPVLSMVVDLMAPEARAHDRFETDLGELLELVFERARPAGTSGGPTVEAVELASRLAECWTETWFPPEGRPASVQPLLAHPWVRVEIGHWPFDAVDEAHCPLDLAWWPPLEEGRSESPRWTRLAGAGPQLVELKIRPDKARAGRVRLEIICGCDLFSVESPVSTAFTPAIARRVEHAFALLGLWSDLHWFYAPVHSECSGASLPRESENWVAMAPQEAVAARLEARIESVARSFTGTAKNRWLGICESWLHRLRLRGGTTPSLVNAERALERHRTCI